MLLRRQRHQRSSRRCECPDGSIQAPALDFSIENPVRFDLQRTTAAGSGADDNVGGDQPRFVAGAAIAATPIMAVVLSPPPAESCRSASQPSRGKRLAVLDHSPARRHGHFLPPAADKHQPDCY